MIHYKPWNKSANMGEKLKFVSLFFYSEKIATLSRPTNLIFSNTPEEKIFDNLHLKGVLNMAKGQCIKRK
jgi:hypothetical protein